MSVRRCDGTLTHIAPRNLAMRQAMLEEKLGFPAIEHHSHVRTAATTPSKPEPPGAEGFRMVGMFENLAAESAHCLSDGRHHLEVFDSAISCHDLELCVVFTKVFLQEFLRETLTVLGEHYRFRFRLCFYDPAFLLKKIHQIPVK
jgi:hypothetical protein